MPNVLTGPCPHCGATVHLQVAVLTAPPSGNGTGAQPTPSDRPTCPQCGEEGTRMEQRARKDDRRFSAYKCPTQECNAFDHIIPDTFRWLE